MKDNNTAELYAGKITALFLPYIDENISEREFCVIQDVLNNILKEIKRT